MFEANTNLAFLKKKKKRRICSIFRKPWSRIRVRATHFTVREPTTTERGNIDDDGTDHHPPAIATAIHHRFDYHPSSYVSNFRAENGPSQASIYTDHATGRESRHQ